MDLSNEQKLLELKRRILANKNKDSAILFELQELNKSFANLRDVISNSREISEIKDNLELLDRFDLISKNIQETNSKIKELTEKKLPIPNIVMPSKLEIKNFPEKTSIDWENAPKQPEAKDYISTPIKTLYKSIEGLLGAFFTRVVGFMSKVVEYITEPDRIVITDYDITEFYGDRKVAYKIKDDGRKREVTRES